MSRSLRVVLSLVAMLLISALASSAFRDQAPPPATTGTVTIIGSVVDASLAPLGGVAVALERDGRVVAKTVSASDGAFRFANIAPGAYRVKADLSGFPSFTRELRVPSNVATIQLPIVLSRPGDKDQQGSTNENVAVAGATGRGARAVPPAPPASAPASMPAPPPMQQTQGGQAGGGGRGGGYPMDKIEAPWPGTRYYPSPSGESYAHVDANRFHSTRNEPLSTFGADVDTASYSNIRRFLSSGQLPPSDAVRVEEIVNYFRFPYAAPTGGRPIGLTAEVGDCPWAPSHKLVLIGARARSSSAREIEGRNIVLLIDVSGSMAPAERLPLIRTALGMFVDTLSADDRIAIVTYAGSSGVALPSTPVRRRDEIQRAIANLSAGGSTNGGQGLILAYRLAREAYIPGGVNRVILATDGDFNVGITSQGDLFRLIEHERASGVFLSVFGVGSGNLKDSTMEMLADKGNGHYAYLDSLQEARRVLVRESNATLETVAKEVKFQVEFNPQTVAAWKQIGYENRQMAAQDFNNDRKDGGEMGAGHSVTALYEIVPAGVVEPDPERDGDRASVDPLKYQVSPQVIDAPRPRPQPQPDSSFAGELLTVKARYQHPEGERSDLISLPVRAGNRAQYLPIASAAAEFGLLLRDNVRDVRRWDALDARIDRLSVPGSMSSEVRELGELVAIARGLARLR